MNLNKLMKWVRRGCLSAFGDHRWRDGRLHVSWVGSPSGGVYVDLTRLKPGGVVYSFGIATEISFDREIIEKTGGQVWGYDPDPRCARWLRAPERWVPPGFHFTEAALGAASGRFEFHTTDIERMTGSLSHDVGHGEDIQVQCLTLSDIMKSNGHAVVDYLKMDIEGTEYEVLNAWLGGYETLPVRQMWVEFHPDGVRWRERDSMRLVRRLAEIGMAPGHRNYFRCPNNYLLVNTRLGS